MTMEIMDLKAWSLNFWNILTPLKQLATRTPMHTIMEQMAPTNINTLYNHVVIDFQTPNGANAVFCMLSR